MAEKNYEFHPVKQQFNSLQDLRKATGIHSPIWVFTIFGEKIVSLINVSQLGFYSLFKKLITGQKNTEVKISYLKILIEKLAKLNNLYPKLKHFSLPKFSKNDNISKNNSLVPISFWNNNRPKIRAISRTLIPKQVIRSQDIGLGVSSTGSSMITLDANTLSLLNNFKSGIRILQFGLLILFLTLGIQTYLIVTKQSINFQASASNQTLETVSTLPTNSEPGLRIIDNFTTNKGVVDIGFSLDVQKQIIKMRNGSNCKTPGIPPEPNGCGITIYPGALGIPNRGTIFKNIQFEGTIPGNSKIKIDLKDFEQGNLVQDLGSFGSDKLKKNIPIPANISSTQGLYLRFWTLGGDISITKIAIEYYNVEQLKPVSGKINPDLLKDIKAFTIWEDKDQNRLWDPKNDVEWTCRPNFPGILPLEFGVNGSFVMSRDDSCFTDIKPDKWYTDKGTSVLPNGMWLLVSQDPQITIPFQTQSKDIQTVMDISSFDEVKYK